MCRYMSGFPSSFQADNSREFVSVREGDAEQLIAACDNERGLERAGGPDIDVEDQEP